MRASDSLGGIAVKDPLDFRQLVLGQSTLTGRVQQALHALYFSTRLRHLGTYKVGVCLAWIIHMRMRTIVRYMLGHYHVTIPAHLPMFALSADSQATSSGAIKGGDRSSQSAVAEPRDPARKSEDGPTSQDVDSNRRENEHRRF